MVMLGESAGQIKALNYPKIYYVDVADIWIERLRSYSFYNGKDGIKIMAH